MTFHYFDSSALTKLLLGEVESEALAAWVVEHGGLERIISCDLAHTEVRRTLHRLGGDEVDLSFAERMLDMVVHVRLVDDLFVDAGNLAPETALRSLDALHTVAALKMGSAVDWFVTYDKQQAECAARAGLNVASPS
ncbi:type II toxin-antitoxin system VapC family toxin [Streptomyces sp.]|uniref:type II toxin-antitoxin system VapC family toxin n=1 Tax=Streptomyces sp. TaxID=1931 RepID=UPI002D78D8B8|nr:type II toxin-antitoxin system VapC family toxin [Streptomyces sp.]HET6359668.1 type II toxin-antitoxin system VapC family toxin [Streptomyces sp.]